VFVDDAYAMPWFPSKNFVSALSGAGVETVQLIEYGSTYTNDTAPKGIRCDTLNPPFVQYYQSWPKTIRDCVDGVRKLIRETEGKTLVLARETKRESFTNVANIHLLSNHQLRFGRSISLRQLLEEEGVIRRKETYSLKSLKTDPLLSGHIMSAKKFENVSNAIRGKPKGWLLDGSVLQGVQMGEFLETYAPAYDGVLLFPRLPDEKEKPDSSLSLPLPAEDIHTKHKIIIPAM